LSFFFFASVVRGKAVFFLSGFFWLGERREGEAEISVCFYFSGLI
jgi:hypothetical protein